MRLKRLFDLLASSLGLIALCPFFLLVALVIKLDSPGPVFFRQERVGRFGTIFRIHKFRTMVSDAERQGPQITVGADSRITHIGAILRKYKLDELPQLIDVFLGNMSIVGPRPEVPRYVSFYPEDAKRIILSVKPGITDMASIEYKEENLLLADVEDPHQAYLQYILPVKLEYYLDYVKNRTFFTDIKIIFATLIAIMLPRNGASELHKQLGQTGSHSHELGDQINNDHKVR